MLKKKYRILKFEHWLEYYIQNRKQRYKTNNENQHGLTCKSLRIIITRSSCFLFSSPLLNRKNNTSQKSHHKKKKTNNKHIFYLLTKSTSKSNRKTNNVLHSLTPNHRTNEILKTILIFTSSAKHTFDASRQTVL